jgi:hypothetical protein
MAVIPYRVEKARQLVRLPRFFCPQISGLFMHQTAVISAIFCEDFLPDTLCVKRRYTSF